MFVKNNYNSFKSLENPDLEEWEVGWRSLFFGKFWGFSGNSGGEGGQELTLCFGESAENK